MIVSHRRENLLEILALQSLILLSVHRISAAQDPLSLGVTASASPGSPFSKLTLSWGVGHPFVKAQVLWEKCSYGEQQLTCREMGRTILPLPTTSSYQLTDSVKYDSQYRVSVEGRDACGHSTSLTSYVTLPRPVDDKSNKLTGGFPLYLVLGPVYGRNLTVSWGDLKLASGADTSGAAGENAVSSGAGAAAGSGTHPRYPGVRGYRVTWRRVDGQVGHPGHESNLLNSGYLIRGLTPGTRYEVCVSEQLNRSPGRACDVVHTLEDVPGPPTPGDGWCRTEAHGTHWRCDVTWGPPPKPNGKIIGYALYWRDGEGYALHEERPPGALCSPECRSSTVLLFHPQEGCVAAITAKGVGWETCVRIQDVQSRLLAVLERRVLYAVAATLLIYILGPRILGALIRCCIRVLERQMDDGKNHVV